MRDQMKEAGITLKVNVMPAAKYWEIWDKTPYGCTAWTHRPLGTMVMSLGYRTGVPWNESHYANPEFDKALDAAEATLDLQARKAKLAVCENRINYHIAGSIVRGEKVFAGLVDREMAGILTLRGHLIELR